MRCTQGSSEPVPAAMAEAARRAALKAKDAEAAQRAELDMVAAVLGCQFGPVALDHQLGTIALQVGAALAALDNVTVLCSVCPSVCLCVCLSAHLSVYPLVRLSIWLLSLCPFAGLRQSASLSVCLSVAQCFILSPRIVLVSLSCLGANLG